MLAKIESIEKRYQELTSLIEQNLENYQKVAELNRELSELEPIVQLGQSYREMQKQCSDALQLANGDDPELAEMAKSESESLKNKSRMPKSN